MNTKNVTEMKPVLSLSSFVKLGSQSYVTGDEAGVVLVEFRLTRKAKICDGDEANVVLIELCLTRKEEFSD